MARRRRAQSRKIDADPIYGSVDISKFINKLMYDGKKSKAENRSSKTRRLSKNCAIWYIYAITAMRISNIGYMRCNGFF